MLQFALFGLILAACTLAFFRAQPKGKLLIGGLLALSFLLPMVSASSVVAMVAFGMRALLGVGCVIWLKWEGRPLLPG